MPAGIKLPFNHKHIQNEEGPRDHPAERWREEMGNKDCPGG
jgi:hypothetical protein